MDWQNCRRGILWFATNLQNKSSYIGWCGSYLIFCQIMIAVEKILVKNIAKIGGHHVNWILKQNLKSSSPVWPINFTAQQFDLKYEIWMIHAELMNYSFSVKGKKENTENLNVSQMTEEHVSANNLMKNMKSSPMQRARFPSPGVDSYPCIWQ